MEDRSASFDRLDALIQGRQLDQVPHLSFILGFCAKNTGCSLAAIYNDPEKSLQAQMQTRDQYGYDSEPFFGYASYGGWEFGGRVKLPDSEYEQAPSIQQFAVAAADDVEGLRLPDVATAGILPLSMAFSKAQVKHGMAPTLVVGGPFTVSGNICSAATLCRWLIKEPQLAHRLLRLATDHLIETVLLWSETFGRGTVAVQIWEPLASNQIISPGLFEKFVLPYQVELNEKILQTDVRYLLCHVCGEQNLNLPHWRQVPMGPRGIISIGKEVSIEKAIQSFGDTAVIAGNVDPSLIQNGPPRDIYEACRTAIEAGKKAPRGFALMEGCEVPVFSPPYNYHMIGKAVEAFGR